MTTPFERIERQNRLEYTLVTQEIDKKTNMVVNIYAVRTLGMKARQGYRARTTFTVPEKYDWNKKRIIPEHESTIEVVVTGMIDKDKKYIGKNKAIKKLRKTIARELKFEEIRSKPLMPEKCHPRRKRRRRKRY